MTYPEVEAKALCFCWNQWDPPSNATVLYCVQHIPVLEIGLLWCVSLSDTCSAWTSGEDTCLYTESLKAELVDSLFGLCSWCSCNAGDWNCHQNHSVKPKDMSIHWDYIICEEYSQQIHIHTHIMYIMMREREEEEEGSEVRLKGEKERGSERLKGKEWMVMKRERQSMK